MRADAYGLPVTTGSGDALETYDQAVEGLPGCAVALKRGEYERASHLGRTVFERESSSVARDLHDSLSLLRRLELCGLDVKARRRPCLRAGDADRAHRHLEERVARRPDHYWRTRSV